MKAKKVVDLRWRNNSGGSTTMAKHIDAYNMRGAGFYPYSPVVVK
ncbi:hypothetical protein [Desulforamulus reducens]|nr:hypothetical protein [Desulforamulus reducens]